MGSDDDEVFPAPSFEREKLHFTDFDLQSFGASPDSLYACWLCSDADLPAFQSFLHLAFNSVALYSVGSIVMEWLSVRNREVKMDREGKPLRESTSRYHWLAFLVTGRSTSGVNIGRISHFVPPTQAESYLLWHRTHSLYASGCRASYPLSVNHRHPIQERRSISRLPSFLRSASAERSTLA